ncbi:MAG TPA: helix-turn-helix transcriptional regulator [Micromonosporaceae bacterium]
MRVVVGVDGSGRTHRLAQLAAAVRGPVRHVSPSTAPDPVALTAADTQLVVVDDAHRLPAKVLLDLAAAARHGCPMIIARRPTIDRPELAELDDAVAARGEVEFLRPLDRAGIATLIGTVTGRPAPAATVTAVLDASAGLPAIAAALAAAPAGEPPPALAARLQRRLAMLSGEVAELARLLALRLDLSDDLLAAAVGTSTATVAEAMRTLRDEGMVVPDGDRMIPAVAEAILADVPPAQRRQLHDAVARALIAADVDPVSAATQLRAARIRNPRAADVYTKAGDRLRFSDPGAAATWYEEAIEAGADPRILAVGRAETAALLGTPIGFYESARPEHAARLALVEGAVAAHDGRLSRAAETLVRAGPPGPVLAVPALVATGRLADARSATTAGTAPPGIRRLAEATLTVCDPGAALPLLIEAAEAVERSPLEIVLPDTPHALGAVTAVVAGDVATAEYLVSRAITTGTGGPVAVDRHRLLLAWVRMRAGRYETALTEVHRFARAELPGRERLLLAALSAGIARRSGDIVSLRRSWSGAEHLLARRAVDLFQLEIVEELVVAAARLGRRQRIAPILESLTQIVDGLGRPPAWAVTLGWIRVQIAVAGDDAAGAAAAVAEMPTADCGLRQQAQAAAARRWSEILSGVVRPDAVAEAAATLAEADLPWEASRLAGQAAIRTDDTAAARRLLEQAREFSGALSAADTTARRGVLSDREVEVARLVLAGRTHREIGAQLYLSPKTVEHHVARIRTKLNATSRAELLAALRAALGDSPEQ